MLCIIKRFWCIKLARQFLLLASKWWMTRYYGLITHGLNSSIWIVILESFGEIKDSISAQTSTVTIWATAISDREILICFMDSIWSHFPLNSYRAISIHLASSITATNNFESIIVIGLSRKISGYRRLRSGWRPHHSLLMLSLIVLKLLIKSLNLWHIVLFHRCHSVSAPPLNRLLCPIVRLSFNALPLDVRWTIARSLLLSIRGHLITRFL